MSSGFWPKERFFSNFAGFGAGQVVDKRVRARYAMIVSVYPMDKQNAKKQVVSRLWAAAQWHTIGRNQLEKIGILV